MKDIESELGGHFKDLVLALYLAPAHYDALSLHKAMKGMGTKESVCLVPKLYFQIKNVH